MKRRDFVKTVALSGMAVAASDLVGDLIARVPEYLQRFARAGGWRSVRLGRLLRLRTPD